MRLLLQGSQLGVDGGQLSLLILCGNGLAALDRHLLFCKIELANGNELCIAGLTEGQPSLSQMRQHLALPRSVRDPACRSRE